MGNDPMEKCWPYQLPSPLIQSWPKCPSWSLWLVPDNPCTKRWLPSIARCSKIYLGVLMNLTIYATNYGSVFITLVDPGITHISPLLKHHDRKMKPWCDIKWSCWSTGSMWPLWFAVMTNFKQLSWRLLGQIGGCMLGPCQEYFQPCHCPLHEN